MTHDQNCDFFKDTMCALTLLRISDEQQSISDI